MMRALNQHITPQWPLFYTANIKLKNNVEWINILTQVWRLRAIRWLSKLQYKNFKDTRIISGGYYCKPKCSYWKRWNIMGCFIHNGEDLIELVTFPWDLFTYSPWCHLTRSRNRLTISSFMQKISQSSIHWYT